MQFSEPVERHLLHSRRVSCDGYLRSDGLLEIEARLLDTRTHDLTPFVGPGLKAGEPLHQMGLRVTVDADMVIRAVQPILNRGPLPECPDIGITYKALVGLTIGKGFSMAAKKLFAGPAGCAHMTELLIPMATVALQTAGARQMVEWHEGGKKPDLMSEIGERPVMLDTCHSYRSEGEAVRVRWPKFYKKRQ